jgi:hypothetical protein
MEKQMHVVSVMIKSNFYSIWQQVALIRAYNVPISRRQIPPPSIKLCNLFANCYISWKVAKNTWSIDAYPAWRMLPQSSMSLRIFACSIANITTQEIERHIVKGPEKIFPPVVVNDLLNSEAQAPPPSMTILGTGSPLLTRVHAPHPKKISRLGGLHKL